MAPKRKAKEPVPEPLATADPVGNTDQNDVEKEEEEDEDEVEVRLLRSVVHDEYNQTSEKKEIKKGGKKKNVVTWKSSCKHCDMEFDHKKTSVLKKHLNSKHPPVGKIVEDTDDHARVAQKAGRVPLLVNKQAIVIDKYVKYLIDDGIPLNNSDSKSFKEFVESLDEDIKIPGRWAITELLDKKYLAMMSKLKERLADARRCHLTMDGWSNRRCRSSFLGATAHYFNLKKRYPESFRLCLRKFSCRHTAENIVEMTQKILDEFEIRHKTHCINTDNGSNFRKALNDLSKIEIQSTELDVNRNAQEGAVAQEVQDEFLPELITDDQLHEDEDDERDAFIRTMEDEVKEFDRNWRLFGITPLRCSSHLMQLPIMKILRDENHVFHDLLVKVRKMVRKYSKSVNAKEELYKQVKMMVVSYVVTRWWSDVDMMERVKKIEQEAPDALNNVIDSCEWDGDLKLVKKDFTLIEKFLKLFKPIKLMSPCWLENSIPPFSLFSPLSRM